MVQVPGGAVMRATLWLGLRSNEQGGSGAGTQDGAEGGAEEGGEELPCLNLLHLLLHPEPTTRDTLKARGRASLLLRERCLTTFENV